MSIMVVFTYTLNLNLKCGLRELNKHVIKLFNQLRIEDEMSHTDFQRHVLLRVIVVLQKVTQRRLTLEVMLN